MSHPTTLDWSAILTCAQTATARVGAQLLQDFGHASADEKADGSLVTQSDRWADAELRGAIATAFPEHGILSEEGSHTVPDTDWCWIIDPLDGTTNFARGLPIWGISLGLLYRGTPVFGYVALPPLRQSFYGYWPGESGLEMPTGAFLSDADHQSDRPIQVSSAPLGGNQFFNLCARSTAVLRTPFPCKIRMVGVATYNLLTVAAGIALGGVEATPKIWDIAAVWAIVQAAGAIWTPLEPNPIFPLKPGDDYGDRPFPTLVSSQAEWVPIFLPYVEFLQQR